jgi:hypothetical protein
MVYFAASEIAEEYSALGFDLATNRAAAYFPARAAALGAVRAGVVQATFFGFSPLAVAFGMDRAWEIATPEQLVQARLRVADRALRRLCGELLDGPEVAEAAALAREACAGCTPDGRPLYAGGASLDWPEPPHLQLFHALGLLREFRGDGHVAALVAEGISGLEAGVLHVAQGDAWTREPLRKTRGWTTEQWDDAVAGCGSAAGWTPTSSSPTRAAPCGSGWRTAPTCWRCRPGSGWARSAARGCASWCVRCPRPSWRPADWGSASAPAVTASRALVDGIRAALAAAGTRSAPGAPRRT